MSLPKNIGAVGANSRSGWGQLSPSDTRKSNAGTISPGMYVSEGVKRHPLTTAEKQQLSRALPATGCTTDKLERFFSDLSWALGHAKTARNVERTGTKRKQVATLKRLQGLLDSTIKMLCDDKLPPWVKWQLITVASDYEFDEEYDDVETSGSGLSSVTKTRRRKTSFAKALTEIIHFRNVVAKTLAAAHRYRDGKQTQLWKRGLAFDVARLLADDLGMIPTTSPNGHYAKVLSVALTIAGDGEKESRAHGRKELLSHGLRILNVHRSSPTGEFTLV